MHILKLLIKFVIVYWDDYKGEYTYVINIKKLWMHQTDYSRCPINYIKRYKYLKRYLRKRNFILTNSMLSCRLSIGPFWPSPKSRMSRDNSFFLRNLWNYAIQNDPKLVVNFIYQFRSFSLPLVFQLSLGWLLLILF